MELAVSYKCPKCFFVAAWRLYCAVAENSISNLEFQSKIDNYLLKYHMKKSRKKVTGGAIPNFCWDLRFAVLTIPKFQQCKNNVTCVKNGRSGYILTKVPYALTYTMKIHEIFVTMDI